MRYSALIPMRAGSKRLPGKHTKPLAGIPPVLRVVDAALGCTLIEKVFVATNDPDVVNLLDAHKKPVQYFLRHDADCTDTARTETLLEHFCQREQSADAVVLIQATNPFLNARHLYAAIEAFESSGATSLISVAPLQRYVYERLPDGILNSLSFETYERRGLANVPPVYVENGSFYIVNRQTFLDHGRINFGGIFGFVMAPETITELDTRVDWLVAETILSQNIELP